MRFKIENRLKRTDYERLLEFLASHTGISVELMPKERLEQTSFGPIYATLEGFGFRIDAEISFAEPIGFKVSKNLSLENEKHFDFTINRRAFKLSKIVVESTDLERDLNIILGTLQQIVNNVYFMFAVRTEKVLRLDSEMLDTQLEKVVKREELQKRGETSRPFGTIHAIGSRDAKEQAGDLIPLYKEHDKTYLYDAKKVYFLLPHNFVISLLRCDATTMVRQEEFDTRSKEVLRDLVYKKHLKKRELSDGTMCYYGLNEKTQRHLKRHLKHKTPRR